MRLRVGYELVYECPQSTPMLLMLNTHYSRAQDMLVADHINTQPWVPLRQYQDSFGNLCTRLAAPPRFEACLIAPPPRARTRCSV